MTLLRLLPIFLVIAYGLLMWRFSIWRTNKMLAENSTPLTDPSILRLTDRFAKVLELDRIDVFVYEIDVVNGLALQDGKIYLTRGFLNGKARGAYSAEELASVVAHELGHLAHDHHRRRMIDFTGQNAVFVVLSALLNRFLPFIGIWIARLISVALMARLSRTAEFEADAYAAALLIKSGIGVGPMKTMFSKLETLRKAGQDQPPAWLIGHPQPLERIAALEKLEQKWAQD